MLIPVKYSPPVNIREIIAPTEPTTEQLAPLQALGDLAISADQSVHVSAAAGFVGGLTPLMAPCC